MSDTTKTGESVIHRRRADDWQTYMDAPGLPSSQFMTVRR